jgi:Phosphodiester glycosidase
MAAPLVTASDGPDNGAMRLLAVTGLVALATVAARPPPGAAPAGAAAASRDGWRTLEPGLDYGVFGGPAGEVVIVRIEPARYELRLLNASAPGEGTIRTARAWAARAGAAAAINAAMYQDDYRTSVSLMRTRAHVNHQRISKDKAVLAFDPLARGVPPVRIIDRECEDLERARQSYGTLVQSIRLVSCDRRNVWEPSPRRVSMAAIGVDGKGRVLFIHARAPAPVHEVVDALLALPIDLRQAMYVEGGPEAQLFVKGGGKELEWVGGFERAPTTTNADAWPVPNVVVAVPRR